MALPKTYEVSKPEVEQSEYYYFQFTHCVHALLKLINGFDISMNWLNGYEEPEYDGNGLAFKDTAIMNTLTEIGAIANEDLPGELDYYDAMELIATNVDKYKEIASKNKIYTAYFFNGEELIKFNIKHNNLPIILQIPLINEEIINDFSNGFDTNLINAAICYGWNEEGYLIQANNKELTIPFNYPIFGAWAIILK